jgi:tetratricopeptide (TPR) repeat protein
MNFSHQLQLQGKYSEAKESCTSALKLTPTYSKALFRRAQAGEKIGSYSSLSESLQDYQAVRELDDITQVTRRECQKAEQRLPAQIKEKGDKEKEEMMGKLKDLGNTLLGKFGLSTDNFQMQKDPSSGNYSVNFVNKS